MSWPFRFRVPKGAAQGGLERWGWGTNFAKAHELSGGAEVAIARAIVSDPDIILADEPTGALTRRPASGPGHLKGSKDRLVVMVTHNADLAEKYSRVDGW